MPDIKQFGLKGVGADVQLGKDGGRIRFDSGEQEAFFVDADHQFYLPVRGADPTDPGHFVTKNFFDQNQTPGFYGIVAREADGLPAFGRIDTLSFNQDDGFYLTQGTRPSEAIVNFAPESAAAAQDPLFRRVTLGTGATQSIGALLPVGAIVNRVKLSIRTAYDNNAGITIGSDGTQIYMPDTENDSKDKKDTIFISETQPDQTAIDGTLQIQATITNAPTVGAAAVLVEYLLP